MKILIFYRDALSNGGVPEDVRGISKSLSNKNEITLINKTSRDNNELTCKFNYQYKNIFNLTNLLIRYLKKNKPDFVIVYGYFMFENFFVMFICKLFKVRIVLFTIGQLMKNGLTDKLFVNHQDLKFSQFKKNHKDDFLIKIARSSQGLKSRFLKFIYIKTIGLLMINISYAISLFSKAEYSDLIKIYPKIKSKFIYTPIGITEKKAFSAENFYFKKFGIDNSITKLLFCGRIDWKLKGIDRLVNAIKEIKYTNKYKYKPFKLFFIGSDYRNSVSKLLPFLRKNNLEEDVLFVTEDMYERGSIEPLRDADVNILLSRWDYFPRTLREATLFEVPVLVSEETNFGDLVRDFKAGIVSKNPDDIKVLASEIAFITQDKYRNGFKNGSRNLSKHLNWNNIGNILHKNLIKLKK